MRGGRRAVLAGLMVVMGGVSAVGAEPEMAVSLKPAARRQPASVDPARPLKPKNHPGPQRLKAEPGRAPVNLRMSPRRVAPLLDIDISIKDE